MKYPYFRGLEADRYSFYRVPKALIKVDLFEKMSGDAKLLYAVLLDRMNLSLKNGWQDENGNAYIICTIDEIMDSIRCARQKAVKLLDELEHEYQLIERRRQGLGKPNLLYVKDLYKDSLVVVAGFIRSSSSGILVTLDTKNLFIDGCAGTWMATEECVVESQHFFLMQHEVYKEKAPNVIVGASGKLVSTEIRKGLDEDARKKILDYLHPPLMEKPMNQKPSLHQMEHYQKFYENGEYVRAVESTTEQNYNMIDGCANNLPKPRIINGRESVLDKLRIRQMAREKQKSSQEQSADMERNRK